MSLCFSFFYKERSNNVNRMRIWLCLSKCWPRRLPYLATSFLVRAGGVKASRGPCNCPFYQKMQGLVLGDSALHTPPQHVGLLVVVSRPARNAREERSLESHPVGHFLTCLRTRKQFGGPVFVHCPCAEILVSDLITASGQESSQQDSRLSLSCSKQGSPWLPARPCDPVDE